jgi:alpha-ribazole phosphatase
VSASVLFVARHAPVAVQGVCYGQSDVPTRMDADEACSQLVAQLVDQRIVLHRIWSSPWKRAREPAERLASRLGIPSTVDARLSELAFGSWEGRPYAELEHDERFAAWMADWREAAPPGGERLSDLVARVDDWRSEVLARGEVALATTHAGVVRALRAAGRGLPYDPAEPVEALTVERVV